MTLLRLLLAVAAALALPAAMAGEVRLIAGAIPGFCEARGEEVGGVSCALVAEMARRLHYDMRADGTYRRILAEYDYEAPQGPGWPVAAPAANR